MSIVSMGVVSIVPVVSVDVVVSAAQVRLLCPLCPWVWCPLCPLCPWVW